MAENSKEKYLYSRKNKEENMQEIRSNLKGFSSHFPSYYQFHAIFP